MFSKILVGLDGSQRESAVLHQAVELADRCGGRLHLCRAMQVPKNIPVSVWAFQRPEFDRFLLEQGHAALERVEQSLPADLVEHRWCELASPATLLCRLAGDISADLLVIGSHGYDRVERVLGTTAAKVVNGAPCTVVVVRDRVAGA